MFRAIYNKLTVRMINMTCILLIFISVMLLSAIMVKASNENVYGNFYNVEYIKNYDGDTVTFNIPNVHPLFGDNISVRLFGIDTPEIKGKCEKEKKLAEKTKEFVTKFLKDSKNITLLNTRRDKYFRILANVKADGKDLSQALIKEGLAIEYFGDTKLQDWCK